MVKAFHPPQKDTVKTLEEYWGTCPNFHHGISATLRSFWKLNNLNNIILNLHTELPSPPTQNPADLWFILNIHAIKDTTAQLFKSLQNKRTETVSALTTARAILEKH